MGQPTDFQIPPDQYKKESWKKLCSYDLRSKSNGISDDGSRENGSAQNKRKREEQGCDDQGRKVQIQKLSYTDDQATVMTIPTNGTSTKTMRLRPRTYIEKIDHRKCGKASPRIITYNKEVTRKELEKKMQICDKLRFVGFHLSSKFLENLLKVSQKIKNQVRSLAFKSCKISDMEKIPIIVQQCKCKKLSLSDCHLSTEQLKEFTNTKIQLDHLDMSYNEMTTEGMKTLGSIVKNCEIKTLILDDCHLEDEHLSAFYDACSVGKLRKLFLRDNPLISDGAVLMKIVRGHNISDLNLSDCSLGTETIKEMLENVEDYQFTTLDLSVSDEIVTEIRAKVLAQIAKLVKKTLWLCFDEVSEKYQKIIEEGLKANLVRYTYKY